MFLYWKSHASTGIIKNENYGSPPIVSGLKSFSSPTYITGGTSRFVIEDRDKINRPTKEGRKIVEVLTTYFGWDELNNLNGSGITLNQGQTKLEFDGEEYRLTELSNMGKEYNNKYINFGLVKAIFVREVTHGTY